MDLTKLSVRKATSKPATLHLKHPFTGEMLEADGKPVTIDLLGAESDAVRAKAKEIEKRRAAGVEMTDAEAGAEMLSAITVGWSNIGLGSDDELAFSPENAKRLYLDPDAEWIVEQVRPFSLTRKNFVANLSSD